MSKVGKSGAQWLDFERLTKRILSELMPYAEVTWNDRIVGSESGTYRQIDVSARWQYEGQDKLLIVQAKDWKKRADIKVVDGFRSVVSDVGASRGILVCSAGFTKNALQYARRIGIDCYNLHDASSVAWARKLTIPFLWIDILPVLYPEVFVTLEPGDKVLRAENDLPFVALSPDGGNRVIRYIDTFIDQWNSGQLSRTPGTSGVLESTDDLTMGVLDMNGLQQWRPVRSFGIRYHVERTCWLGQYEPQNCRGFIDLLNEDMLLLSYLNDEATITRNETWKKIPDPSIVPLKLRGTLLTASKWELDTDNWTTDDFGMEYLGP